MKICVILHKDVYNIPTYHVVKEMLNRQYDLDFFAFFMDHIHLRMFENLNINIKKISKMRIDLLNQYDFIYSAVRLDAIPHILEIKKYIFTFSTAFMDEPINFGDYTFTQRDFGIHLQDYYYAIDINNELKSKPGLVVGNPKFDFDFIDSERIIEKQILFVDAGHFPYGKNGKMEVAKMLVDIARRFPQYNIMIKPRFLPGDKNVTHRSEVHVYECILEITENNIPSNMHCLYEHVDLEKLVRESSLIITPDMTTSYLDIARYDKSGLIASGIPSEYTVTHNKDRMRRIKNIEKRSGLCVNYKEIHKYIPEGKKCRNEHIIEMGLKQRDVSRRMVDTMEKIYRDFISKDRYPSPYSDSYITFKEVMSLRYIKLLFGLYETYEVRIESLDFGEIDTQLREYYRNVKTMSYEDYTKLKQDIMYKIEQVIINAGETLMQDEVNRGYYLQTIYENKTFSGMQDKGLEKDALYCCLLGKFLACEEGNYDRAIECLKKYFVLTENNTYEKTLADTEYYKESATYWLAFCFYQKHEYDKAKKYFQRCEELTNNGHKKAKEYLEMIERI